MPAQTQQLTAAPGVSHAPKKGWISYPLAAEHFKTFDRTVAPWIAAKAVRTYDKLDPR